jgi:acetyl esterase/lipase
MKRFLPILLLALLSTFSHGQDYCIKGRFAGKFCFSESELITLENQEYGRAMDWKGKMDTLRFSIAMPDMNKDKLKKRPFVLLLHGGGYQSPPRGGTLRDMYGICIRLAAMGYVTATIDYRVGWQDTAKKWDPKMKPDCTGIMAAYRAMQDARAALRFFVQHADDYGIDTGCIYMGGRSAGGEISLYTAFFDQHEIDAAFTLNCHRWLGPVDSSSNTICTHYHIKGVIDMWGGLSDTSFISQPEALSIPLIVFHGTADPLMPYKKFGPPDYAYTRYGAFYIAARYKHLGGCCQLNSKTGAGHGEGFDAEFLAAKIGDFLKSQLCGTCHSEEFTTALKKKP